MTMSGHAALNRQAAPGALLTRGQATVLAVQVGLLAALLGVLLAVNYARTSLLFSDPLGQKMLTSAGVLLALGLVLQLLVCVILNHVAPVEDETLKTRRFVLSLLLEVAHLLLFYLPAVFVLLVGPSAIEILRSMTHP
jgi:hypothetical protein